MAHAPPAPVVDGVGLALVVVGDGEVVVLVVDDVGFAVAVVVVAVLVVRVGHTAVLVLGGGFEKKVLLVTGAAVTANTTST